jgi:hypothetical protein
MISGLFAAQLGTDPACAIVLPSFELNSPRMKPAGTLQLAP